MQYVDARPATRLASQWACYELPCYGILPKNDTVMWARCVACLANSNRCDQRGVASKRVCYDLTYYSIPHTNHAVIRG
jgi:hypothetical protein